MNIHESHDGSFDVHYLWRRVDGELQLRLLPIINGKSFHQEGSESRAGAAAERVEDEKSLKAGALVGEFADAVEDQVDDLLADRVVSASVVVGRVLFARDELFRVEELPVCSGANFIYNSKKRKISTLSRRIMKTYNGSVIYFFPSYATRI